MICPHLPGIPTRLTASPVNIGVIVGASGGKPTKGAVNIGDIADAGRDKMPIIKTDRSRATVAQPVTSVAGPSTPTPKRVSRNPWSSPKKPHASTASTPASLKAPSSPTANNLGRHETRDGSDDTLSGDIHPLAMRASHSAITPADDETKDPDDATGAASGSWLLSPATNPLRHSLAAGYLNRPMPTVYGPVL